MNVKDAGIKRLIRGEVVSCKMDKTIIVITKSLTRNARFGKIIKRSKQYKVHDETGVASVGDLVDFYETRPLSKTKYMMLDRVAVSKASEGTR